MSLLYKDGEFVDKEYADFTAEMYAEGHSFFTYISDSPDTLSSCCFSKEQKVLWKSSNRGVNLTTLEELHNLNWDDNKKNLRIFHNGSWVKGKTIKLPNRPMYKVITENNKEFLMTDNHINVTIDGEKPTSLLTTNDYLMFNTQPLNEVPENNENLTYEQGFTVGAFLGDGNIKNELDSFMSKWILCEPNVRLNLDCLLQNIEFRKGILDGLFESCKNVDNENSTYLTKNKDLVDCVEALITSLGKNSVIYNNELTYYISCYSDTNVRENKSTVKTWVKRNNSIYFKIKSIELIEYTDDVYCVECKNEDEPYFTLPSGLITHNCRLSNKITENTFSFTNGLTGEATGSKSVISLNYNRITQNFIREVYNGNSNAWKENKEEYKEKFKEYLIPILERVYKYHTAYNEILWDLYEANMLPVYSAGFIHLNKQYLTLGINGVNEAWMFLGGECRYSEDYVEFCKLICGTMKEQNTLHKTKKTMFNSEFVPKLSGHVKPLLIDLEILNKGQQGASKNVCMFCAA